MPDYRAIAAQKAQKYGVPVDVFLKQIQQESGFNPSARSGAGAQGIAQFMPATARQYGVNTADPVSSLDGAARMDAGLIKKYGIAGALSAYNSGNPNAYKDPNFAGGQTYNYVRSILGAGGTASSASPSTGGAGVVPSPSAPAAPATAPAFASAAAGPDPRLRLLQALQQTRGGDLTGFYQQLGQARQAQANPPVNPSSSPLAAGLAANPSPATPAVAVAGSASGGGIAKTALTQIGIPYQWGGAAKLGGRTDCSGLLQASARANGINIGRTTYEQYKQGTPVPLTALQPGDAVFFHMGPRGPEHVAIFIGGGRVVEDPHTGASVEISQLAGRGAVGARRY
jgi:cell wall-associated NlpC family hydrolase